ncbi:hypothetical protein CDO73_02650 [Saccharibacillus sp. O23]|uniref:YxiG family protein n=1 Tax=Saccharibacillus sp. O23 TaxID=2009338 RepID=UPI000B4E0D61|nr:hypothetical protein [Saccharibacillus sp. O23]OWR32522.1 hypothetical protein CDO73_02650 [Saccharibacillus sp. O23]
MRTLEELTSLLWGCEITDYHFDLKNHSVSLNLKRVFNHTKTLFEARMKGVCSFSWINAAADERKKVDDWEYIDLVSFDVISGVRMHIKGDDFLNDYVQAPNLCLEIGDSVLLIEARFLCIDGEDFEL